MAALDRDERERMLIEHLPLVRRVARALAARHGLGEDTSEEFTSAAVARLVEHDYAVLGQFRGESTIATFLTVVLAMHFRDWRAEQWGRWRPSAAARRLGPVAVRLETLTSRDGLTLREASERLRTEGVNEISDRELLALVRSLPQRQPLRPVLASDSAVGNSASADLSHNADAAVLSEEQERAGREARSALASALSALPDEEQLILRLRYWEASSVADIARTLNAPQKPLYRRLDRALRALRGQLEKDGWSWERVGAMLGDADA